MFCFLIHQHGEVKTRRHSLGCFGYCKQIGAVIYYSQVIPQKYRTDGVHIAVTTVNDLDLIVSLNFQHIVKRKTKIGTNSINALNGYHSVEIANPMEVIEYGSD